jgi:hypothetical protein
VGSTDTRRKTIFALGLCVLIAWATLLGLASSKGGSQSSEPRSAPSRGDSSQSDGRVPHHERSAVARSAMEFTDAYLAYEVGELGRSDRLTLTRLSTRQLGAQLLRAPPRIPSSGEPAREWASRVEAVHVGIFDGAPALLVGVLVVGLNGAHVLTPTFVERGSQWLVAGIGA